MTDVTSAIGLYSVSQSDSWDLIAGGEDGAYDEKDRSHYQAFQTR